MLLSGRTETELLTLRYPLVRMEEEEEDVMQGIQSDNKRKRDKEDMKDSRTEETGKILRTDDKAMENAAVEAGQQQHGREATLDKEVGSDKVVKYIIRSVNNEPVFNNPTKLSLAINKSSFAKACVDNAVHTLGKGAAFILKLKEASAKTLCTPMEKIKKLGDWNITCRRVIDRNEEDHGCHIWPNLASCTGGE